MEDVPQVLARGRIIWQRGLGSFANRDALVAPLHLVIIKVHQQLLDIPDLRLWISSVLRKVKRTSQTLPKLEQRFQDFVCFW